MKKILKAVRDSETGDIGLIVQGMKIIEYPMVSMEGMLIAHDLLEHQNGVESIGSIGDEIIALGGVWFVRGELFSIRRSGVSYHTPIDDLASDIHNLFTLHASGVPMRVATLTRKHNQDENFEDIADQGIKSAIKELTYDGGAALDKERTMHFILQARHLMRRGYMMANKRFESQWKANQLFWNIADAVDNCIDFEHLQEGQQFELVYNYNGFCYCDDYWEEDYYA